MKTNLIPLVILLIFWALLGVAVAHAQANASATLPAVLSASLENTRPFSDSAVVDYELLADAPVSILLFNMMGEQVQQPMTATMHQQGAYQLVIPGHDLLPGLYFLRFETGGEQLVLRLVKSHGNPPARELVVLPGT